MIRIALSMLLLLGTAALTVCFLPDHLGRIDLVQYWASAKLLFSGLNPYDPGLLHAVEQSARPSSPLIRMWNPPFIFPFIYLFGFLDFQILAGLWCWITVAGAVCCFAVLQKTLLPQGNAKKSLLRDSSFYFLVTFFPIADIVSWGQISILLLFAMTGFCYFRNSRSQPKQILAGGCLSLSLIKPHLLFLIYCHIALQALFGNRETIQSTRHQFFGFILGATLLASLSLLIDPQGFADYSRALSEPPIYFQTPTLGSWLQDLTNTHTALTRFLPSLFALALLPFLTRLFIARQDFVLGLVPLSLASSPYGWGYDQILLLPVALLIFSLTSGTKMYLRIASLLILGNITYLLMPGNLGQQILLWYPIFLFSLYWCVSRSGHIPSSGKL
jgi:hypothetical protein